MNNKVLVEVSVPAATAKFDVFIPIDCVMGDVLKLLSSTLSELTAGKYKAISDAVICELTTGKILDVNMVVADLNIKNGTQLMLI